MVPAGREAIELSGVSVAYNGRRVVDEVDLSLEAGHWLALIGPNGAGKTTLLRVLTSQVEHAGTCRVLGRDITDLTPRELGQQVALVPQNPVVPAGMSVGDYVLLGRTPHLGAFAFEGPDDQAIASSQLERLDLGGFEKRELATLSGGELQRVVLARALAQQAPILLLDEPTSALDVGHQQQVLELVDELRREDGLTIVAAMHDLNLAGQFAERLALLSDGAVVADGPASEVLTEDLLREHYGATVRVLHDECDGVIVVPLRTMSSGRGGGV